jgi:head-tail adaptor
MRSGLLRDYVEIQRNTPTQGNSGEEIDNWSTHINTWVWLRASGGEESINEYKARMRYADVNHTDRILFGSRVFDIVSVLDKTGLQRELELELREDTNEQA